MISTCSSRNRNTSWSVGALKTTQRDSPRDFGGRPACRSRPIVATLLSMTSTALRPATVPAHADAPERDRFVDLVRAGCIVVVISWHWVLTTISWQADGPHVGNPIPNIPFGWLLTWIVQPMPLFFLVGGHLHRRSLERGGVSAPTWVGQRLRALVLPILPLLAGFVVLLGLVSVVAPGRGYERALILLISPLWFLAVYVVCVAIAPVCLAGHRRHAALVPAVLVGSTVVLDVLRFGEFATGWWSLLTMITVWATIHHLGLVAWDLVHGSRRTAICVMTGGYVAMTALVLAGPYAAAMVGVQGQDSNFSPATLVVIALGIAHLGLAAVVRPSAERWLDRSPRLLAGCTRLNASAMKVFAWHLPAWGLAYVALRVLAFPIPSEPDALWWLTRPVWFAVPAAVLLAPAAVRRLR